MGPAGAPSGSGPLNGILGSILGEDPAQQKARIEEATKKANDLSGLVRHKKKPAQTEELSAKQTHGAGKRKLDLDEDGNEGRERAKSARVDEVQT